MPDQLFGIFVFVLQLCGWVIAALTVFLLSAYAFLVVMMKLTRRRQRRAPAMQKAVSGRSHEPHELELIDDGLLSLARRLEMIRGAKKSIDLEFFIYKVDHSSRLITQALAEKAGQGVKVRILVDFSFAVFRGRPGFARYLQAQGVEVRYYNTSAVYRLFAIQHRSHRKLLIVDDEVALTGGRNIADDYFDLPARYNFIDSDIMLRGPLVAAVKRSFDLYWDSPLTEVPYEMRGPKPKLFDKRRFRPRREDLVLVDELLTWAQGIPRKTFQCNNVEFVTDYPGFGRGNRQVYEQIESLFKQAKRKILIETPYFITMDEGQRILTDVEAKGVDVTVLTNSLHSTDAYYAVAAMYPDIEALAKAGVEIMVYDGNAPRSIPATERLERMTNKDDLRRNWSIHAKRAVIDDEVLFVGTYNIDPRSANLNSELVIIVRDCPEIVEETLKSYRERCAQAANVVTKDGTIDKAVILRKSGPRRRVLFYLSVPVASLFDFLL